jgi:hypothetical protein
MHILMKLVFMCMVPLHWITTVLGWLPFSVNGFVLWSASLSRADLRCGSISVVLFRNRFSKRIISRINLGIGSFRLQQKNLTVRNQPCVGSGQSDFLCCGHRMDLGLSGKRIWQFELHTQQFVILWYQNRAWRFAYMCLGAIVFGQSIQASSMLLPCHDSDSLGWTGFG